MGFITDTISWIVSAPFIVCGWLIIGAIAGDVARRLMGSKDVPFWSDILLGILGAIVGGFIAGIIGLNFPNGGIVLIVINLGVAIAGASFLIWLRRAIFGSGKKRRRSR